MTYAPLMGYPPLMGYHGMGYYGGMAGVTADEPGSLADFDSDIQDKSQNLYKIVIGLIATDPEARVKVALGPVLQAMNSNPNGPLVLSNDDQVYQVYSLLQAMHDEVWMDGAVWDSTSKLLSDYSAGVIEDPEGLANLAYELYEKYFSTYYDEDTSTPAGTPKRKAPSGKTVVSKPAKTPVRPLAPKVNVTRKTNWGKIFLIGGTVAAIGGIGWALSRQKSSRGYGGYGGY